MALEAAAAVARSPALPAYILSDAIEGEAREVGKVLAGVALQVAGKSEPFAPPCVLLSGGETTVTVKGAGSAGATSNFCCLSASLCAGLQESMRSRATPTGSMDKSTSLARF